MPSEDSLRQPDAAQTLGALLQSGRLPHAFLFTGATGTGRLAAARRLAAILLCTGRDRPNESCGRCAGCQAMAQERHPDYFETGVPEGKQALPIESVREVQRVASIKPVLADRRVFVIRDAESMSAEAANCFLKTLEEPPGGCLLILIASGLRQIPATILSRCRLVRFRNMPPDALQRELEAEQVEPAQARWLARRAWGSPGLARQLLEMGLPEFNNRMLEELRTLSPEDNFRLSDWVNEAASSRSQGTAESRAVLQDLLECLALYYRDLALAAAAAGGTAELCNAALADQARELTAGRQAEFFASQADLVLEAIERVGGNANRQLALDWLFTRLGRAQTAGTKGTA